VDSSYIVEEAPHKMSGTFTISQNDLQALYNEYNAAGDYLTSTQIGQYLKKSYKTGVFKITRIGLLREAKWAKENEHDEWHRIITSWAEK